MLLRAVFVTFLVIVSAGALLVSADGEEQSSSTPADELIRTEPVVSTEEITKPLNATISKWQYCTGCVETAFTFNRALAAEFAKAHTKGVKKVRNAYDVLNLICDSPEFQKYQPFVKLSCIKMVDEHAAAFVEPYGGATSSSAILTKREVFDKTKRVCVDSIAACDPVVFADLPLKKKDKCAACHVIAEDIETIRKTMLPRSSSSSSGGEEAITETRSSQKMKKYGFTTLQRYFEETFCETLGFRHKKYAWLETRCEEMMEDHLQNIVEVMDFQEQLSKTGFSFTETLPQRLCNELYQCGSDYKLQYADEEL